MSQIFWADHMIEWRILNDHERRFDATEFGVIEGATLDIGIAQSRISEVCTAKVGTVKPGILEIHVREVHFAQVTIIEMHALEIDIHFWMLGSPRVPGDNAFVEDIEVKCVFAIRFAHRWPLGVDIPKTVII